MRISSSVIVQIALLSSISDETFVVLSELPHRFGFTMSGNVVFVRSILRVLLCFIKIDSGILMSISQRARLVRFLSIQRVCVSKSE
mgnify:CR=1 FL=1